MSENFRIHKLFQTVFLNVVFLYVGQISFDIPTWLKRHITAKYQVSKIHYARYLITFFLVFFSKKSNIASENRKKPSWCINCYVPSEPVQMKDDYLASGFARVDDSGNVDAFIACLSLLDSLPYFRWYKAETYRHLSLEPGLTVLDVGCGLGDDACRMYELIAPNGRIFGVDYSAAMIAEARRRAHHNKNLSFEVGNAKQLPFEAGTFDRVRIDRTLQHIAEPEIAVTELWRVLKPGGLAVAYDNDWGSFSISSEKLDITRQIQDEWCYSFTNPWIGRHLNLFFLKAGFVDVAVQASVSQVLDFDTADRVYPLKRTVARLVQSAKLSRDDADEWVAELEHQTSAGAFRAALTAYFVVGRKQQ